MNVYQGLGLCGLLLSGSLPAIAQSQRFPTEAELPSLRQQMHQRLPDLQASGYYSDRRTLAERWVIAEYARAWAAVDPAIAPYLGEWTAIEEALYIYPSSTPGEVCVIDINLDEGEFYTGQVQNGMVYASTNQVFFLDGDFLGSTFVYDNQPGFYEYSHPYLPPDPTAEMNKWYPTAVADFVAASCGVGLPSYRQD